MLEGEFAKRGMGRHPEPYEPSTHYTAMDMAEYYRIPVANRAHPLVQEFTSMVGRLDNLDTDAHRAASGLHDERINHQDHAHEQAETSDTQPRPDQLAPIRELFGSPDMTLTLEQRYAVVSDLTLAARFILTEGLGHSERERAGAAQEPFFRLLKEAASELGFELDVRKAGRTEPPEIH